VLLSPAKGIPCFTSTSSPADTRNETRTQLVGGFGLALYSEGQKGSVTVGTILDPSAGSPVVAASGLIPSLFAEGWHKICSSSHRTKYGRMVSP